jgi:hypothetical protein
MPVIRLTALAALVACGFAIAYVAAPPGGAYARFGQVVGSGEVVTQQRSVGPFHRIAVSGSTDVTVSVGGAQTVALEAQPNIAEVIETNVNGGTLEIRSNESYTTRKKVRLRVTVPSLDGVRIAGSADVTIDGARGPSLDLATYGSGDFDAAGNVERLTYEGNGSGDARLARLVVRDAVVRIHGSGTARLHVNGTLSVEIAGSGDVTYIGTPRILRQTVHGSGSVTAAGGE